MGDGAGLLVKRSEGLNKKKYQFIIERYNNKQMWKVIVVCTYDIVVAFCLLNFDLGKKENSFEGHK